MSSFSPPFSPHRAFILPYHVTHGILLLLHPPKVKKGKPEYWQLPGGRVDSGDYDGVDLTTAKTLPRYYMEGAKRGALRELEEETGIKVGVERLAGLKMLYEDEEGGKFITHEYKNRFFFTLSLTDADFHILHGDSILDSNTLITGCSLPPVEASVSPTTVTKKGSARTVTPTGREALHLGLMLSHEHTGFTFVPDLLIASGLVKLHSGGVCSEAAVMAMRGKAFRGETRVGSTDWGPGGDDGGKKKGGKKKKKKKKGKKKGGEEVESYTPLRRTGSGSDDEEETKGLISGAGRKLSDEVPIAGGGGVTEVCCGWWGGGEVQEEWQGGVKEIGVIPRVPKKPKGGFIREDRRVLK